MDADRTRESRFEVGPSYGTFRKKKADFRWRLRISLNQKSAKYDQNSLGGRNFYFLQSSKILIEQKVTTFQSLKFDSKTFPKVMKIKKYELPNKKMK